ncbi:unnamed protein product [Amaranthus hypochondriacus]
MAFSIPYYIFIISILTTKSYSTFEPKALVIPISKDPTTHQYTTNITQRTPPISLPLTLDLGTQFLWVTCNRRYKSSTYHPIPCNSPKCMTLPKPTICKTCRTTPKPGCNINTCRTLTLKNPITNIKPPLGGELSKDIISINSTNGSNPGQVVTIPNFLFVCAPPSLVQGLTKGSQGVAGFGRSKNSIPNQFSSYFHFPNKFSLCLPSSGFETGAGFFGPGPYNFFPGIDLTTLLSYTPLLTNKIRPSDYYIGVTQIKIFDQNVPINKSLLSINSKGYGGTMISVVDPFTIMETSIFMEVSRTFNNELTKSGQVKRVNPVAPFEFCYDPTTLPFTRIGPFGPDINLVMQSEKVVWTISGQNYFVRASNEAYCLGLVNGGKKPKASIVIGGFQLEDNFVEFDVGKSRVGFSNSLLFSRVRCSNFNFTSTNV